MSDLTAEQFQLAVAAAIEGVENLYRQVDLLIAKLREQLAEDPDSLTRVPRWPARMACGPRMANAWRSS